MRSIKTKLFSLAMAVSMVLALAGCVGLLLTAMTVLTPVMTFLRRLASLAGVNPALLAPVLKAAAVGLLTQLTE